MKEFSYKKIGKEIGWDFSKINCKTEYPSNYNYYQSVINEIKQNETVILDIGCGSGEKSLKYFSLAKRVEMIDLENEMLKKVHENITKFYGKTNTSKKFKTKLVNSNEKLPYKNNSFDLVVSRHCGGNLNEIYRVLKKGGVFISEDIDETDCLELKELYLNGQGYKNLKNGIRLKQTIINNAMALNFSKVELLNFDEIEYYKSKEDLEYLLDRTPILDGVENYHKKLDAYISSHTKKQGILLSRKLFAFKLIK